MKLDTKKLTGLGMVVAISSAVMLLGFRFMPTAQFLKYEAKDVILTIGGFIYGPIEAVAASAVVALLEFASVSETGAIGLVMNILAASSFAGVAALVYMKRRTANGALAGLLLGSLALTAAMLLWNYLITPIYMGVPREAVAKMLLPVFLPFNLIKAGLNTAIVLLVYKPLTTALRSSGLLPRQRVAGAASLNSAGSAPQHSDSSVSQQQPGRAFKFNSAVLVLAAALILACAAALLLINRK